MPTQNNCNTYFTVSSGRQLTQPLQPAFFAQSNATASDKTGDGTVYNLVLDVEAFDRNADYDTGTGTFTAPLTGVYAFNSNTVLFQLAAANTTGYFALNTSNRAYYSGYLNYGACMNIGTAYSIIHGMRADMDAGDTAYLSVSISGAAKIIDVLGNAGVATSPWGIFTGYLI